MVSVRECEPADLDTFQALGSEVHVDWCRERFARDDVVILVAAAEEFARARGHSVLTLGVEDNSPRARAPYERLGYEPYRTAEFVYVGAPVPNPGVWMRKELA